MFGIHQKPRGMTNGTLRKLLGQGAVLGPLSALQMSAQPPKSSKDAEILYVSLQFIRAKLC